MSTRMTVGGKIAETASLYQERAAGDGSSAQCILTRLDFMAHFAIDNASMECEQTLQNEFGRECLAEVQRRYAADPIAFIERYTGRYDRMMSPRPRYRVYEDMADAMFRVSLGHVGSTEAYSEEGSYGRDIRNVLIHFGIHLYDKRALAESYARRPTDRPLRTCEEVEFGDNMSDDARCFGRTVFDISYR